MTILLPALSLRLPFIKPWLTILWDLEVPVTFSNSYRELYLLLLQNFFSILMLHHSWNPYVSRTFSLTIHWQQIHDNLTENFKNDLAWLITLCAVKVRNSLLNWGYIDSSRCASCPLAEMIDQCILNCQRVRPVWLFFSTSFCHF